jgi:uncharacterized membrane protein
MNIPTWLKTFPWTMAILASGAALRAAGLMASPIWYDEAWSLALARLPLLQAVRVEYSDFAPPLWTILTHLLPAELISLRLLALACSLLAMWLAWQLVKWLAPEPVYLPAAALIAYLPYHWWLAQDGRPYALLAALYLAVIYLGLRQRWLLMTGAMGLLCYTHSTGMFYAASACLGLLIYYRPIYRRQIILAGLGALVSMIPWLPTYFQRVGDHWLGPLTVDELLKALYFSTFSGALPYIWAYGAIWLLLISIAAGFGMVLWRVLHGEQASLDLTVWAWGPLAILLVVAIAKNLIFYRPLSGLLLPVCIWLAVTLWPRSWKVWIFGGWLLPYLWALVIVVGLVSWSPVTRGGELRDVANRINSQWQTGDIVYHATGTSYLPASLYLDHPGYLLDEIQHDGLLQTRWQALFGIPRADLGSIPHQRVWVFWAKDILMSPAAWARMQEYTAGGTLVGVINYWQASDIYIYLVEDK